MIIQQIIDIFYVYRTKNKIRVDCMLLFLNVWLVISTIYLYTTTQNQILQIDQKSQIDFYNKIKKLQFSVSTRYAYTSFNAVVWLRVLFYFRATRTLGPLVKTIQMMSVDIARFLILLILILIILSCVAAILLGQHKGFETLWDCSLILYSWTLGGFELDTVQTTGLTGQIYMMFVLLVNLVLMLNLLIAILSSTYANLENKGVGLYLQSVISVKDVYEFNQDYNALTFKIPFLNIINFMFLYCLKKKVRYVNRALEILNYLPIYLVSFVFLLVINVIALPFAYILTVLLNIRRKKTLAFGLLMIFLYPIFAVVSILSDLFTNFIKMFKKPLASIGQIRYQTMFTKQDFESLIQILQKDYDKCQSHVLTRQIIIKFRKHRNYTCTYEYMKHIALKTELNSKSVKYYQSNKKKRRKNLTNQLSLLTEQYTQVSNHQINNQNNHFIPTEKFNAIKEFLFMNSYPNSKEILCTFPSVLLEAVYQIKVMSQIWRVQKLKRNCMTSQQLQRQQQKQYSSSNRVHSSSLPSTSLPSDLDILDTEEKPYRSIFSVFKKAKRKYKDLSYDVNIMRRLQVGQFMSIQEEFQNNSNKFQMDQKQYLQQQQQQQQQQQMQQMHFLRQPRKSQMVKSRRVAFRNGMCKKAQGCYLQNTQQAMNRIKTGYFTRKFTSKFT